MEFADAVWPATGSLTQVEFLLYEFTNNIYDITNIQQEAPVRPELPRDTQHSLNS